MMFFNITYNKRKYGKIKEAAQSKRLHSPKPSKINSPREIGEIQKTGLARMASMRLDARVVGLVGAVLCKFAARVMLSTRVLSDSRLKFLSFRRRIVKGCSLFEAEISNSKPSLIIGWRSVFLSLQEVLNFVRHDFPFREARSLNRFLKSAWTAQRPVDSFRSKKGSRGAREEISRRHRVRQRIHRRRIVRDHRFLDESFKLGRGAKI